jgi:hypothetical protein
LPHIIYQGREGGNPVKRDLVYVKRGLVCVKRDLRWKPCQVKLDLVYVKRVLVYVKRDLVYVKRGLVCVKGDLRWKPCQAKLNPAMGGWVPADAGGHMTNTGMPRRARANKSSA